ncbi:MAG: GNAT family N-acetyltransferase [Shimia sp.]
MLRPGPNPIPPGHLAAVTTHLVHDGPPVATHVPDPRIAPWAPSVEEYRATFRAVGAPWLWCSRLALDPTDLAAILSDPAVELSTIHHEGAPAAILELDFRRDGACEIAFFGLAAPLIGTGAGRALMAAAIARAYRDGPLRLHLHTSTHDSPQALGFYRRAGFRATHQDIDVFLDPRGSLLPADAAPHIPHANVAG